MGFFLCIETATNVCSVSIGNEHQQIHLSESHRQNSHTESITLQIKECVEAANISYPEITAVGISAGPGSYTGLRVGTSAAKGLCFAHGLPLVAIPTLYGLAYPHRTNSPDADTIIIPMIDARRMEVYAAIYNSNMEVIKNTFNWIIDESISESLQNHRHIIICGNGSYKVKNFLKSDQVKIITSHCSAKNLLYRCIELYKAGYTENIASFSPEYYKKPNITKSKKLFF